MANAEPMWIYVTTGSPEEAGAIARVLVRERLVACANIVPGMRAIFWWQDDVQEEDETILIAKTRGDLVDRVRERVVDLHSYECPCVVALPIVAGNPPFLDWIRDQTAQA